MISKRLARKGKQENQIAWFIIIICFCVIGTVGFLLWTKNQEAIVVDKGTNCPVNGVDSLSVVYIDTTDGLSRDQSLYINRVFSSLLSKSKLHDKFVVYFLTNTPNEITAQIEVCNPGDGANASTLTSNKRKIQARWKDTFINKLTDIFANLESAPEASQSPIIEGLKYISTDVFVGNNIREKNIYVISDLLQHSSLLSHYSQDYDISDLYFKQRVETALPYLEGVNVEFFYISRHNLRSLQTNKHIVFWEKLVLESGGLLSDIHVVK